MTAALKKPPRPKSAQPRLLSASRLSNGEPRTLQWTRTEYHRLADEGFFRNQRVQLIEGSIIEMSPQKNTHSISLLLTCDLMRERFGSTRTVRYQLPLKLSEVSEPEPDVAIVVGKPRDWTDHPTTADLVIEISDSTLKFDLKNNAALYA